MTSTPERCAARTDLEDLMKSPVDELEAAVLSLSQHDRARLAERLIASLDEPSEVKAAWVEEIAPARAQRSCRIL
jgi:hypothetical protein